MRASYGIIIGLLSLLFIGLLYAIWYDILLQMIAAGLATGYNVSFWQFCIDFLNVYFPGAVIISIPVWVYVNAQRPQPGEY